MANKADAEEAASAIAIAYKDVTTPARNSPATAMTAVGGGAVMGTGTGGAGHGGTVSFRVQPDAGNTISSGIKFAGAGRRNRSKSPV